MIDSSSKITKISIKKLLIIQILIAISSPSPQKSYFLKEKSNVLKSDITYTHKISLSNSKIYYKERSNSGFTDLKIFEIPDFASLNLTPETSSLTCFEHQNVCIICSSLKCFSVSIVNNNMNIFNEEFQLKENPDDPRKFFKTLAINNTDYFLILENTRISRWTITKANFNRFVHTGLNQNINSFFDADFKIAPYTKNLLYVVKRNNNLRVYDVGTLQSLKLVSMTFIGEDFIKGLSSVDAFGIKVYEHKAIVCSLNGFCGFFNYNQGIFIGGIRFSEEGTDFMSMKIFPDSKFFLIGTGEDKISVYDSTKFGQELINEYVIDGEQVFRHIILKENIGTIIITTGDSVFEILLLRDATDQENYCFDGCSETNFCNSYYHKANCNGCKTGYSEVNLICQKNDIEGENSGKEVLGGVTLQIENSMMDETAGEGGGYYSKPTEEPSSSTSSSSTTEEEPKSSSTPVDPPVAPLPNPLPSNKPEIEEKSANGQGSNYLVYGIIIGCVIVIIIVFILFFKYKKEPSGLNNNLNEEKKVKYVDTEIDVQNRRGINIHSNPFKYSDQPPEVKRINQPEGEFIESTGLRSFKLSVHGKKKKKKMEVKKTPNRQRRPFVQNPDNINTDKKIGNWDVNENFDEDGNYRNSTNKKKKVMSFGSSNDDVGDLKSSNYSDEEEEKVAENGENQNLAESNPSLENLSSYNFEEDSHSNSQYDPGNFLKVPSKSQIKGSQDEFPFSDEDIL